MSSSPAPCGSKGFHGAALPGMTVGTGPTPNPSPSFGEGSRVWVKGYPRIHPGVSEPRHSSIRFNGFSPPGGSAGRRVIFRLRHPEQSYLEGDINVS